MLHHLHRRLLRPPALAAAVGRREVRVRAMHGVVRIRRSSRVAPLRGRVAQGMPEGRARWGRGGSHAGGKAWRHQMRHERHAVALEH
eukprot:588712-Pelagomonas_calceolata.AAC.2